MRESAVHLGRGARAGVVATLAMSGFMVAARRAGWLFRQAPEEITEESIRRTAGPDLGGRALDLLTAAAHLGFGLVGGALYAASLGKSRRHLVAAGLRGALYGTVIWVSSYWGVLPALGLMPPPSNDERARAPVMVVAHWIYGFVLGVLTSGARGSLPR